MAVSRLFGHFDTWLVAALRTQPVGGEELVVFVGVDLGGGQ